MGFKKATKAQAKARIGLIGPAGSGKTYTALKLATNLGKRVAVIDTERGSASKYADEFDFDVMELDAFHPQKYIDGIKLAEESGYDVLVIDSLSHAWMGKEGALELVDKASKRTQSGNNYFAWREVTPLHNALVDAMLQSKLHLIATMRSKMEYIIETNEKGKQVPRKVGLAPIQRDGLEYEFDIVADMDLDNNMIISKTRCRALTGGVFNKPGEDVAQIIKDWLTDGVEPQPPKKPITKELVGLIKTKWLERGYKSQALNVQLQKLYQANLTQLTMDQAEDFLAKLQETEPKNDEPSTKLPDEMEISPEEIDKIFANQDDISERKLAGVR